MCLSCNEYSVSEKQAESFLKYFPISINDNTGSEVIQTLNGGYVILSNFTNLGISGSDRDIPVIFCDEFGRQGSNSPLLVGTNGIDLGNSLLDINDGYIIAGSSSFTDRKQGFLMKLGSDGQVLWQKNFGGFQEMEFLDVTQSLDNGFIATGFSRNNSGKQNVILLKVSASGDSLWMREIPFDIFNGIGESVLEYEGERILITGTISPIGPTGSARQLILNTDLEGRGYTDLKISDDQDLFGKRIIRGSTGELYILGNEVNALSNASRVYLARLELAGGGNEIVTIAASTYLDHQGSIYAFDIKPGFSGNMAICGWESAQNDFNIYFGLVDEDLRLVKSQSFGSKGYQSAHGLCITGDGGYALTGTIDLGGGRTSMLLKLDNEGELR